MSIAKGQIVKDRVIESIRSLTREDLARLKEPRAITPVKTFRDSHHRLARLIASGARMADVVAQSGYSHVRINTLMPDPAFQNLIQHYREMVNEAFVESVDAYHELATSNMLKAERMLADKLDQASEDDTLLPTRDLIAISRDAADRFGYGKRQTNLNVNMDFAAMLEKRLAKRLGAPPPAPAVPALPASGHAVVETERAPVRRRV